METLLSIIAIWLSVNFSLPAEGPQPSIELYPEEVLSQFWVKSVARHEGIEASVLEREVTNRPVRAFYDDHLQTIFLTDEWDLESPRDVSVLVHEMVHHLQNLDQRKFACSAEREKLAYKAQDAWLGLFQTSLEDQFEIDPMTLLVSTKCMN